MRCEDARKYLGPYLDSELDPKVSFDIAQHLETCAECRARFESERALEGRVAESLKRAQEGDDKLWAQALERTRPRRWWKPVAAVAALAATVAIVLLTMETRHDLLEDLRHDHEKLAAGQATFDLKSSDPQEIERFFGEQMGLAVRLRPVEGMEAAGARRCTLRGTPTAFVAYRCGGEMVSVAIFDAAHLDRFPRDRRALAGGALEGQFDGTRIVAERSGWAIVCVTGRLPFEDLRRIASAFRE